MDPEGKTADEYGTHTRRRHRHPEGKSLSHIIPSETIKPVLISTSAAMRGFMQLRDMMIMAVLMQRALGQPRNHEIRDDRWSSSDWQQCSSRQQRNEGWEESGWQSNEDAQHHTDGRMAYRNDGPELSSRSQEGGREAMIRQLQQQRQRQLHPSWSAKDQEDLEWADKEDLRRKIESKERGPGGNRRRFWPAITKKEDSDDEWSTQHRAQWSTVHIRCRKHDRDEEDLSEEKSAERGETKIAKKNEEEQKESGKEREEERSEEGSDASGKTWLSWGPWANACPSSKYQKEEASSSNRKEVKREAESSFWKDFWAGKKTEGNNACPNPNYRKGQASSSGKNEGN